MTFIDIFLLTILLGFVFYGLFYGLIRVVGAVVSVVIALWVATFCQSITYNLFGLNFLGLENNSSLFYFFIVFIFVNRFVSFVFSIINQTFNIISIIPFLKSINHISGALLGFTQGTLVIGIILYIIFLNPILYNLIGVYFVNSSVAVFFLEIIKISTPILPEIFSGIKKILNILLDK